MLQDDIIANIIIVIAIYITITTYRQNYSFHKK